jgi:hypothetical protein
MGDSYKSGFDFIVKAKEIVNGPTFLSLKRKNGTNCICPFNGRDDLCGSHCPHFIVENCNIVDKRCQLILTCGKNISRLVEIIE